MLARVLALALLTGASAVHLTPDNFDDMTAGKSVFLKFYAPWCGHCKKIAPDWNKLMEAFPGDKAGKLVAEVDCTAEGKPLCDANGVKGGDGDGDNERALQKLRRNIILYALFRTL
jgi:thiol-disulfide isomerase/thioredoxin